VPPLDLRIELDKPVALANRLDAQIEPCRSPPKRKGPARHQRTGPTNY
jgi:hypothetical protein